MEVCRYETYPHLDRSGAGPVPGPFAVRLFPPKQAMKDFVVKAVTVLGFREEGAGEDEEATKVMATAGGDVTFPEGFDSTSAKLVTQAAGDTLYVAFNGIQNRSTEYFVPASDSITVTGSNSPLQFRRR